MVVLAEDGSVLGWVDFTVTVTVTVTVSAGAPAAAWLASTGTTLTGAGALAAKLLATGVLLLVRRKQRLATVPAV